MTSAPRVYAVLAAVVLFFLSWAVVAAHPWRQAAVDPRVAALAARRASLQREAARVQRVLNRRWAAYRTALAARQRVIAAAAAQALAQQQTMTQYVAAPTVVSAPPATATHSS